MQQRGPGPLAVDCPLPMTGASGVNRPAAAQSCRGAESVHCLIPGGLLAPLPGFRGSIPASGASGEAPAPSQSDAGAPRDTEEPAQRLQDAAAAGRASALADLPVTAPRVMVSRRRGSAVSAVTKPSLSSQGWPPRQVRNRAAWRDLRQGRVQAGTPFKPWRHRHRPRVARRVVAGIEGTPPCVTGVMSAPSSAYLAPAGKRAAQAWVFATRNLRARVARSFDHIPTR